MLRILLATIVSLPCALAVEVISLADAGPGSLRQAVASGKVRFDPRLAGKTILLTKPLELGDDAQVEIDASAAPGVMVSGGGACRILVIGGRAKVAITGLGFTQGRSSGTKHTDGGGAIFMSGQGTLTLKGCAFRDNVATGYGCAAIYVHWKHTTLIEDCTFTGNDSWGCVGSERGAAAIGTGSFGSLTIRRSTFSGNKAAIGTINCMLSELLIEDSVFTGNLTEPKSGFGGAIYTDGASGLTDDEVGGTIALRRCRFEDNVGASEGGAAFLYGYRKDGIVVERCLFRNNRVEIATVAKPGVAMGGALRIGSKATPYAITDSMFIGNRAAALGGAIWAQESEPSRIANSLFDGNVAADMGGAICVSNEGPLVIERCTIVGNESKHGGAFAGVGPWVTLSGSVVVGNRHTNPWNINQQTTATLSDGGRNVVWPAHAGSGDPKNSPVLAKPISVDPQVGPLEEQGFLLPVRQLAHPELRGQVGVDVQSLVTAVPLAKPVKERRRPAAEQPRKASQAERLAAWAAEDAAVPARAVALEAVRAALRKPGALRGVRWKSASFGDCDVLSADAAGVTVAAFGSETALPWSRIADADLLQIGLLPAQRSDPVGMAGWLHLALYAGWTAEDALVAQVSGELLRVDRPRFEAYRALCLRLRG